MRIEFDPTNRDEATAVRAVLAVMYPEAPRYDPTAQPATFRLDEILTGEAQNVETREIETPWADTETTIHTGGEDLPVTDSTGEPHDPRIHSTPAKTNADGTWRAKRGVKAGEIAAVRAEREQAEADENSGPIEIKPEDFKAHVEEMTNGAATVDSSGEVVRTAPPAPPEPTGQSEAPLAPESATTVTVEASTLGSEAPTSHSFLDVMKAITAAQKDGKIDTAKVKELCAAVGAGESTMGLNGPDNGDKRVAFMALLAEETK